MRLVHLPSPKSYLLRSHRKYKVLRQIAAGAFGSVHCVQRKDTKVIHAAKYVKSKTDDLEREVKALRELSRQSREQIQCT